MSAARNILENAINFPRDGHYVGCAILTPDEAQTVLQELNALRAAAGELLLWRMGNLPNLGYIRDNDDSRAAVKQLALAMGWDSE
jgi:hypothetical protein